MQYETAAIVLLAYGDGMASHSLCREVHLDQLVTIERLLQQYRDTKDRELLRQAILLWDQAEADRARLTTARRQQKH